MTEILEWLGSPANLRMVLKYAVVLYLGITLVLLFMMEHKVNLRINSKSGDVRSYHHFLQKGMRVCRWMVMLTLLASYFLLFHSAPQ